jgi:predicted phosphate transport protein (TIGR00153 family)
MFGAKNDRDFFDAFSKHAKLGVEAARKVALLLENLDEAENLAIEVKQLEEAADTITHDTITKLHANWITPLDRGDIHRLITRLDDVLDMIEAVSERVAIFHIKGTNAGAIELAGVLVKACETLSQAVDLVPNVSQSAQAILAAVVEINRLENAADHLYRKCLSALFNPPAGDKVDPLEVMKWREIFDYLENATDACEDVANILEGIVLEYA